MSNIILCPAAHAVGQLGGPDKYACGIVMIWGQHSTLFNLIDCSAHETCSVWRAHKHSLWREKVGTI